MPRFSSDYVPSYRLHRQSGQAIVTIAGRDHTLGLHGTPASRERYNQLIAGWYAAGRQSEAFNLRHDALPSGARSPTVEELIAVFWAHAQGYYRDKHGRATSELGNYRYDLRLLRKLFGGTPATQFGPLALKAVQHAMIAKSYGRKSINRRVNRLRHVFKYAAGEELIPSSVYEALRTVSGLKAGRTAAVETPPVRPATESRISAVIAVAGRHIGTLIELGSVTGMRPGEMLSMHGGDIDRSGPLWTYTPRDHKTAHLGLPRVVYLGGRAQELLLPFLKTDPEAYLFSPAEAEAERRAARAAARTTPVSAGNRAGTNRRARPKKQPGAFYTVPAFAHAVAAACSKAFPPPPEFVRLKGESVKQWRERLGPAAWKRYLADRASVRFHPHQLRHTAATRFRRESGSIETAGALLGQKSIQITELYAEQDTQRAMDYVARNG